MLTEMWEDTGVKPPALENRPKLIERWNYPYRVWLELAGSRRYTAGGAAEIPFSEFYLWAVAHNYDRAEMECMWEDLHIIDKVWLQEITKIQKAQAESAKTSQKVRS